MPLDCCRAFSLFSGGLCSEVSLYIKGYIQSLRFVQRREMYLSVTTTLEALIQLYLCTIENRESWVGWGINIMKMCTDIVQN